MFAPLYGFLLSKNLHIKIQAKLTHILLAQYLTNQPTHQNSAKEREGLIFFLTLYFDISSCVITVANYVEICVSFFLRGTCSNSREYAAKLGSLAPTSPSKLASRTAQRMRLIRRTPT